MQTSALLRPLLLACCLVAILPACVKIERIDARGNPMNKPAEQPIVGTHVSPPEPH